MGVEERGYWGGQDLILITLDQHECFSAFHHLQKDKQRKQRHSLKLGKKRRESSKRNYYIISPRVIIKAIIIIFSPSTVSLTAPSCHGYSFSCSSSAPWNNYHHFPRFFWQIVRPGLSTIYVCGLNLLSNSIGESPMFSATSTCERIWRRPLGI